MKPRFKIAVIQLRTELDRALTMEKAERMIKEAASNGARVVALPEMWNCPYSKEYFRPFAEAEKGQTKEAMSRWARENGVILVGGSVPERVGDKLYNTCFIFDKDGKQIARHRKIHLFDVDIEGGIRFKESNNFAPGEDITVFDTEYGRMGVLICFDMRFPELVRAMADSGSPFAQPVLFCKDLIVQPRQLHAAARPSDHIRLVFHPVVEQQILQCPGLFRRAAGQNGQIRLLHLPLSHCLRQPRSLLRRLRIDHHAADRLVEPVDGENLTPQLRGKQLRHGLLLRSLRGCANGLDADKIPRCFLQNFDHMLRLAFAAILPEK